MSLSSINTIITEDYLRNTKENLYFDRKRAKYSLQDLANEIASFANANGGVIALGVTDEGVFEGFNIYGDTKLNECQKVSYTYLNPAPICKNEIVEIENSKKEKDCILLIHIEPSVDYIVRNNKDEVYLRQGDSSIKLTASQIKSLEYEKRERNFETEVLLNRTIDDIDEEVMEIYKKKICASDLSNEQILKARGFLVERRGKLCLTKAGVLLFGKNPTIDFPCARVRVLKFEGTEFQVGTEMNVIKDRTFDKNLYRIINEASEFISSQLREFTFLHDDGLFKTIPEYPEFAWYEGLVNAVTHRDYSYSGDYIRVKIFDDRLEVENPGKFVGLVTPETMTTHRYSRNPQISRVLTEFGFVRETNEGVKRMIDEMRQFYLKDPVYSQEGYTILLTLDNNIEVRSKRKNETMLKNPMLKDIWKALNLQEQNVLKAIYGKGGITSVEVASIIGKGKTTAVKLLNKLIDLNLIVWDGTNKSDTHGKYIMK